MIRALFTGLAFSLLLTGLTVAQNPVKPVSPIPETFCISEEEFDLYRMINDYRKHYNLPVIPLSKSLCYVAGTHAKDLFVNQPDIGDCNFHSWSDKGTWTPFCYPADEDKKRSVWDKPKELTNYPGPGYEIVYWENSVATNDSIIAFWQSIGYFNNFLKNSGKWAGTKWNAIGIGIYETYACAWFGEARDPESPPVVCGQQQEKTEPPVGKEVQQVITGNFYVIVKSMLPLAEAKKLASSLVQKGYSDAMVMESGGKTRVVIFRCSTREEANQKLPEARKLYKDAWILVP